MSVGVIEPQSQVERKLSNRPLILGEEAQLRQLRVVLVWRRPVRDRLRCLANEVVADVMIDVREPVEQCHPELSPRFRGMRAGDVRDGPVHVARAPILHAGGARRSEIQPRGTVPEAGRSVEHRVVVAGVGPRVARRSIENQRLRFEQHTIGRRTGPSTLHGHERP